MAGSILGFILVIIGASCVGFGLLTGAMPPFPSKFGTWSISYRDEDAFSYWLDGGCYAALASYGGYLLVTNWTSLLKAFG